MAAVARHVIDLVEANGDEQRGQFEVMLNTLPSGAPCLPAMVRRRRLPRALYHAVVNLR